MTLTSISLIITAAALVSFFLARGKWGWVLFICALLFAVAGFESVTMLEKGSQNFFARLPLTVTQQAWALNLLGFIGIGTLAGTTVRGALALVGKRAASKEPALEATLE